MAAIVIPNSPYNKLSTAMGGWRIRVCEIIAGISQGWKFMGVIQEPKYDIKVDFPKVFDTASGSEVEFRRGGVITGLSLKFKAPELMLDNMRRFWLAQLATKQTANPTASHPVEAVAGGAIGEQVGLAEGTQTDVQMGLVTVYDATVPAAPVALVLNTDYTLTRVWGQTTITWVTDQSSKPILIGEAPVAPAVQPTAYHFVQAASAVIAPMTRFEQSAMVEVLGPSKNGPNLRHRHQNCQILGGAWDQPTKMFTTAEIQIDFLDNSLVNAAQPFGSVEDLGYDPAGAVVI